MVTLAQRREAVAHLIAARQMNERRASRVVSVERALGRYRSRRPDDAELRTRLRALALSSIGIFTPSWRTSTALSGTGKFDTT
jgi:hypothetical protein